MGSKAPANGSGSPSIAILNFPGEGPDEVPLRVGDLLVILDNSRPDRWRVKNVSRGEEGIVPAKCVAVKVVHGREISPNVQESSPNHPKITKSPSVPLYPPPMVKLLPPLPGAASSDYVTPIQENPPDHPKLPKSPPIPGYPPPMVRCLPPLPGAASSDSLSPIQESPPDHPKLTKSPSQPAYVQLKVRCLPPLPGAASSSSIKVVRYDFTASAEKEISVSAGDKVELLSTENGWALVKSTVTSQKGYIPAGYVRGPSVPGASPTALKGAVTPESPSSPGAGKSLAKLWGSSKSVEGDKWYHGPASRQEAEGMLSKSDLIDGTFLVRQSETAGGFVLSARLSGIIHHYKINKTSDGKYGIKNNVFPSLSKLVEYYQSGADIELPITTPYYLETLKLLADWDIASDALALHEELGSGRFGTVWRGTWLPAGASVAVKVAHGGIVDVAEFKRKSRVLKLLRHPNIVQVLGVHSSSSTVSVVMEFVAGCSLNNYLKLNTYLPVEILISMSLKLGQGMAFLEALNVVHRDLAARNVLILNHNTLKIVDTWLSEVFRSDPYDNDNVVGDSFRWMASEVLDYGEHTSKSDVWSYGVLLWEMFSEGERPYQDKEKVSEVTEYLKKGKRLKQPEKCPKTFFKKVMAKCWLEDPPSRPAFKDIVESLVKMQTSE